MTFFPCICLVSGVTSLWCVANYNDIAVSAGRHQNVTTTTMFNPSHPCVSPRQTDLVNLNFHTCDWTPCLCPASRERTALCCARQNFEIVIIVRLIMTTVSVIKNSYFLLWYNNYIKMLTTRQLLCLNNILCLHYIEINRYTDTIKIFLTYILTVMTSLFPSAKLDSLSFLLQIKSQQSGTKISKYVW